MIKEGAKYYFNEPFGKSGGKSGRKSAAYSSSKKLAEYLNAKIIKAKDCIGREVEDLALKLKPDEILLLENLRFHKEEEENGDDFAEKLARLGDIYINDAFSASHRSHTSIVGITKYLPSGAGFLLEKEIKILSQVLENPLRPLVVIIGGVKIATKIGVISKFLKKADHLLLGGEVANAILIKKGLSLGKFLTENGVIAEKVKEINITNPKLHLPVDGIISLTERQEGYLREGAIGTIKKEEKIFDIGPETIKIFSEIIKQGENDFVGRSARSF